MPGTAHSVVNDESIGQCRVIMRAMCPDRKQLRSTTHKENLLVPGITNKLTTIGKFIQLNSLRQIGTAERGFVFGHFRSLS